MAGQGLYLHPKRTKLRLDCEASVMSPPQYSDTKQWLQVELPHIKKITGIITQGAKSLGTEMYVISYSLQYSDNGEQWQHYTDDDELECKVSSAELSPPPPLSPLTLTESLSARSDFLGKHQQRRPREKLHLPAHLRPLHPHRSPELDEQHHHEDRAAGL